jgi:hypothetical protein
MTKNNSKLRPCPSKLNSSWGKLKIRKLLLLLRRVSMKEAVLNLICLFVGCIITVLCGLVKRSMILQLRRVVNVYRFSVKQRKR